MKVAIFGTGYVGLVSGVCLASVGHDVMCVDIDKQKVERLKRGEPVIYEPGLADMMLRAAAHGRLHFTTDPAQGVRHGDIVVLAVGTPQGEDGSADLMAFFACARTVAQHARDGQIIVDKSTVPVGTARKVEEIFERAGKRVNVVSNPETLREGSAIGDFVSPDRVIIGARTPEAFAAMRDLYSPILIREERGRLLEMTPESAELVKYAANSMLAQRVSFINYLAQLAERVGADVRDVRRGVGTDSRIGMQFLYPGPGFGGSCFPKDVNALLYQSRTVGLDAPLLEAALATNESQHKYVQRIVLEELGDGTVVAIWGLAFKARTDDARDSPSIPLAKRLIAAGKTVLVHDPQATKHFLGYVPQASAQERDVMLKRADLLVIMTEWDEYRTLTDEELDALRGKTIVDMRNILARDVEQEKLERHGVRYRGIGIRQSTVK